MIKTLVDSREIDLDDIYALASVDVKEKEPGLQELAQHLRVPFVVFSAGELKKCRVISPHLRLYPEPWEWITYVSVLRSLQQTEVVC